MDDRAILARRVGGGLAMALSLAAGACRSGAPTTAPQMPRPVRTPAQQPVAPPVVPLAQRLIPAPVSLVAGSGAPFVVSAATSVVVGPDTPEARAIGEAFAAVVRRSTGFPVVVNAGGGAPAGSFVLRIADRPALGEEGYELTVAADSVRLVANRAAGLFWGTQTIRQLLPPGIEAEQSELRMGAWEIPAVMVADQPRFVWRGAMLDVARHFFTVREVEQFIDLMALYKLNILHLHLADDQGWRIAIMSRPTLTSIGGSTQVGGGAGGFYTQQDYATLIGYARDRYITIVPEIDMPGHSNAALTAFPELGCGTRPPALYTGVKVGFSTWCVDKEGTYQVLDDIIRELAAMTPGAFFHMGGDEVEGLTHEQYTRFVERVQDMVGRHGKRMVGWEEVAKGRLHPTTIVQQWKSDSATMALQYGAKLILSPAPHAYLDMKYTPTTEIGLRWAGYVEVKDAYDWDPASYMKGVAEKDIIGVEAPIWSETLRNITAVEYLTMPRLPALAEVAWTPVAGKDWEGFRLRLAAQAPRWRFLGINYYRSPQIPW